jgi:hypothetical protein
VRDVARAPPPDTGDTVKADRLDEVEVEDVQLQDDPSDDRDPCKIKIMKKNKGVGDVGTGPNSRTEQKKNLTVTMYVVR